MLSHSGQKFSDMLKEFDLSSKVKKTYGDRFKKWAKDRRRGCLSGGALKQHKFLERVSRINSNFHTLCSIAISQAQIISTKLDVINIVTERI